jgi:hypothetical protein
VLVGRDEHRVHDAFDVATRRPVEALAGVDRELGQPRGLLRNRGEIPDERVHPGIEVLGRSHFVDEPDLERTRGAQGLSAQSQPAGPRRSYDPRESADPSAARNHSKPDLGQLEGRWFSGDSEVAGKGELERTADTWALDGRDARLLAAFEGVEDLVHPSVLSSVLGAAQPGHLGHPMREIEARAEVPAGRANHEGMHVVAALQIVEGRSQRLLRRTIYGVELFRAGQREPQGPASNLEARARFAHDGGSPTAAE